MATRQMVLTQGQVALVDEADHAWLSQWKWTAMRGHRRNRFAAVRNDRKTPGPIYMHREILGLKYGDPLEADHINHNTLDNRRTNLRIVTPRANKQYQPSRGGSSRFVGVTWDRQRRLWRAQIQVDGVVVNLGRYETEEAAALARDRYVIEHGTAHQLNLPSVAA